MLLLRDSILVIPPLVLCSEAAESFIGRSRLLQHVSVLSFALRCALCYFCSGYQWRFSVCSSPGLGSQTRLGFFRFTLKIRKFGILVSCKPCPWAPTLTSGCGFLPGLLREVPALVWAGEECQDQAAHVHG